jgi:hypothetical protein
VKLASVLGARRVKGVKTVFQSGCGSVVLMDEAAQQIAALDIGFRR